MSNKIEYAYVDCTDKNAVTRKLNEWSALGWDLITVESLNPTLEEGLDCLRKHLPIIEFRVHLKIVLPVDAVARRPE